MEIIGSRSRFDLGTRRGSLAVAWVCALLLPCLAEAVTANWRLLEQIPAAFFLAAIAITASLGYTLPTASSIILSVALHNYFLASPKGSWTLQPEELTRDAVLILVATLIGFSNIRLKRTQAALASNAASYRTTLASIGEGVIATDLDGMVTFMNPVAEALTGSTEAEARGRSILALFCISDGDSGEPVQNPVEMVRRLETVVNNPRQVQLQRPDGSRISIEESAAPIRTPDGQQSGIILVFRDVSERRETEIQLKSLLERAQSAENELRHAVELYQDQVKALGLAQQAGKSASWVMDVEQKTVKFLPGGYEIFGMPFEDLGDRRPISMVEPEDQSVINAALNRTLETGAPFSPNFACAGPTGKFTLRKRGVSAIRKTPASFAVPPLTSPNASRRNSACCALKSSPRLAASPPRLLMKSTTRWPRSPTSYISRFMIPPSTKA